MMTYRPLADVQQLCDGDRVLITREAADCALLLEGWEASLWGLWARGLGPGRAVQLLCLSHDLPPAEGARRAATLARRLRELGLLEVCGG